MSLAPLPLNACRALVPARKSRRMTNVNNPHSASSLPTCDTATAPISPTDKETITLKSGLINLLPTEILEIVFIHCASDHYRACGSPAQSPPGWVNVSYVSHRWRNVALNCPTLWTYFFVTSPRWTDELLARSKQASLRLHLIWKYSIPTHAELRFLEKIMNHGKRIQEFRLHIPVAGSRHGFFSKLSPPAPRFQTPHIPMAEVAWRWQWPSVLFDGDTPALHTLELTSCPVQWYSLKLSGLTTLSLRCIPDSVQQNTVEFLATLGCMQELTYLYLDDALASATGFISSAMFPTFQKIDLPHLSRLLIIAPLSTVVAMLSCVNIPLNTQVRLQCRSEQGFSLDDHTLLSSSLTQRFNVPDDRGPSSLTIRSLVVDLMQEMVGLTCSTSDRDCRSYLDMSQTEWESHSNIPFQIIVYYSQSMTKRDKDYITSDICCSIPWTNVQTVHALNPPFSSTFWNKTLGHFQELKHLRLSCGNMPDLAPALSATDLTPHGHTEDEGGYANRGPDRLLVPVLEELELDRILLLSQMEDRTTLLPIADAQSLYDALSTRKGSPGQLRIGMTLGANTIEDDGLGLMLNTLENPERDVSTTRGDYHFGNNYSLNETLFGQVVTISTFLVFFTAQTCCQPHGFTTAESVFLQNALRTNDSTARKPTSSFDTPATWLHMPKRPPLAFVVSNNMTNTTPDLLGDARSFFEMYKHPE
ncbi:hypothetical protein HD554DRAFT_2165803 [Boletus coccyginus]|nr:hypothetical protein HD554DRAFT_2165803 [Boletus coccyginus]